MRNLKANRSTDIHYLKFIAIFLLVTGVFITIAGCAIVGRRPRPVGGVVYIRTAPPEPRVETSRPPRPSPKAIWIPGYWRWNGRKYVWVEGHWDKNPRGATWVPGHWEKHSQGWFWVPGHWR